MKSGQMTLVLRLSDSYNSMAKNTLTKPAQWHPAVIAEWTLYLRNLRAKNKRRDLFRQVIQRALEITKINL